MIIEHCAYIVQTGGIKAGDKRPRAYIKFVPQFVKILLREMRPARHIEVRHEVMDVHSDTISKFCDSVHAKYRDTLVAWLPAKLCHFRCVVHIKLLKVYMCEGILKTNEGRGRQKRARETDRERKRETERDR